MRKLPILALCLSVLLLVIWAPAPLLFGQRESVRPGVNKSFEDPDVDAFVGRFEREGRDAYDHREAIVTACQLKPGMAVADIGAGTGLFTRLFAHVVGQTGHVYAVDIAQKFVDHINEAAEKHGLENITGVVCQSDAVNLPAETVDLAFICDTYHHFEFPHKTMQSIHRAVRPGGQLILIDFHRIEGKSSNWILGHVRAGQEVFVDEIQRAGFRQVATHDDLLDESYFVRFAKTDP